MQYVVVSLSLWLPNEIYITQELSSSSLNGSCLGSCCTLCCNSFFVPRQYINFMSQQATTGSLCRAKQCLIGFRSMVTPPEACFHLLFQQHLERNGGDYIPPAVSRRTLAGLWEYAVDSHGPCCPDALFSCWQTLSCCCCCWGFCYSTAETSRFKGNHDKTCQINYCTNSGTVEIPNIKKESICSGIQFTSLLQSKSYLLLENLCNTINSLFDWKTNKAYSNHKRIC